MKLSGTTRKKKTEHIKKENKSTSTVPKKGGRIALISVLAVVALVLLLAVAGMTYVGKLETIFPNVCVDGIDVGGLTIVEAADLLRENGIGDVGTGTIRVAMPLDVIMELPAAKYISSTPPEDVALMAYNYCKGGSAVDDATTYLRCRLNGADLISQVEQNVDAASIRNQVENAVKEVQLALLGSELNMDDSKITVMKGAAGVSIDVEELSKRIETAFQENDYSPIVAEAEINTDQELDIQEIYDSVFVEKADASFNEKFEIQPEKTGIRFDLEKAKQLWDSAGYGEKVQFDLILEEPEVTSVDLEKQLFRDLLSSKTTSLWGSTDNRINNVSKAASSINGVILLPGEEFSYNPTLGKRTPENGYLLAGAYSGGQTVQEYGGGICQVSSTLYYCCLYANLKITSRTCHYFPVSYLPAGLDATVSWGGPEYKFVNNRDYPIKIVASADAKEHTITVEIWGTDVDGTYVEMTYGTWIVYDEEYPDVAIGYKAKTTRNVYSADGTRISSREEASSYYHYHDEDIKWPEESEEPQETENPQVTPPVTDPEPTTTPEPIDTPSSTETPEPENTINPEENQTSPEPSADNAEET